MSFPDQTPEQRLEATNAKLNRRLALFANVAVWLVALPLTVLYVCGDRPARIDTSVAADAASDPSTTPDERPIPPAAAAQAADVSASYNPGMADADVDRLTTYAVVLGRGVACGVDTSAATEAVGAWIEAKMPPGSPDRRTLFPIFAQGIATHAAMQRSGRSPDGCDKVREQFAFMPWP